MALTQPVITTRNRRDRVRDEFRRRATDRHCVVDHHQRPKRRERFVHLASELTGRRSKPSGARSCRPALPPSITSTLLSSVTFPLPAPGLVIRYAYLTYGMPSICGPLSGCLRTTTRRVPDSVNDDFLVARFVKNQVRTRMCHKVAIAFSPRPHASMQMLQGQPSVRPASARWCSQGFAQERQAPRQYSAPSKTVPRPHSPHLLVGCEFAALDLHGGFIEPGHFLVNQLDHRLIVARDL